ncbi:hypothetical protein Q7F20_04725 [Curtobacterium sp. A7_M15]|nr:hypothetical protein [Curtobacterium sp. A7_M15]MDP4332663.1 hypothetical protein [Curtobacterium sp. A7_M15]
MTISFPPLPAVLHVGAGAASPTLQTLLLPVPTPVTEVPGVRR